MRINIKSILFWFFLLSFDVLIVGGIGEIWVRLFIPVQNVCYEHDRILGDMNCPNQRSYGYVEKGYSNILETNSLGFHDVERTRKKKEGTLRIHIYGDSLVGGIGVPTEDTIPSQLEQYLNKTHFPLPVEILNMASAEDSTCAELLTFRTFGVHYSPDVVILSFGADFRDNIFETHQRTRSPYFTLGPDNNLVFVPPIPVDMNSPIEKLKKDSMLVRLLANKVLYSKLYHDIMRIKNKIVFSESKALSTGKTEESKQAQQDSYKKFIETALTKKAWPVTMRMLQIFKKEVEEAGGTFMIYDYIRFTPNIAGTYSNEDLKLFCRDNNIPYIRIYEEFEAIKKDKLHEKYILKDGHPTSLGNAMLAKILGDKLRNHLETIPIVRMAHPTQ